MPVVTLAAIAVLVAAAYECLAIIAWHYGLSLPVLHPLARQIGWQAGPIILLCLAGFAYAHIRKQSKLSSFRRGDLPGGAAIALARGKLDRANRPAGPNALERLAGRFIWLAIIAVPYWLALGAPEAWAGMLIGSWWLMKKMLKQ